MTRTKTERAERQPRGRRTGRQRSTLPTTPRRWGQMAGAVMLIVGAALGGALLFINAGKTTPVLAVRDGVAAGSKITENNLIQKQVAGVDGTFAAGQPDAVIGKTANVGLVAGQVITNEMVTANPVPAAGFTLVGLSLTPAQMPGAGLEPGDYVSVIAVAAAGEAGKSETGRTLTSKARVYAVARTPETGDQSRVVTIVATEKSAPTITSYAATGRAALFKLSAAGN